MLWSIIKLLFALPVVILLAYISLRLTNQYLSKQGKGKSIQVMERIPINNKSTLCVVKAGEEYLLLGVSDNNIQMIKKLEKDEVVDYAAYNQGISFKDAMNIHFKKLKKDNGRHE